MAGWFPELGGLAGALGEHAGVLDGEVVAFDAEGRPSFEALQQRMASRVGRRRGAAVTYLVFDLLWLDGRLLSGGQAAPEHLPARPADPELAQTKHYQRETFLVGGFVPDRDQGWESGRLRHPAWSGLSQLL